MKNKLRLLRIFFIHPTFDNEIENQHHYFFNQISLFIIQELDNYLTKEYKSFVITLGTPELWSKYYKLEEIPNIHYKSKQGDISENFDYDKFFKLDKEKQKLKIFNKVCDSLISIAQKGKQIGLKSAIIEIQKKYSGSKKISCEYITLNEEFHYRGKVFTGKVIFKFLNRIYVNLSIEYHDRLITEYKIGDFEYGYIDWYLTVFRKIKVDEDILILKGSSEAEELPMNFNLKPFLDNV